MALVVLECRPQRPVAQAAASCSCKRDSNGCASSGCASAVAAWVMLARGRRMAARNMASVYARHARARYMTCNL
eukprot:1156176-Prymnesium_polylepis.1